MKKILILIASMLAIAALFLFNKKDKDKIIIGIIEPIEHRAMDEIVVGFSEEFTKKFHKHFEIKVENAQNDNNLQRAILQKMNDARYNLVVPIGTMATEMAVATVHNVPILSLAANFNDDQRKNIHPCNVSVVHDEIPIEQLFKFIHSVYPNLKNIALIHSSSDKVLPDVPNAVKVGNSYNITVNHFMVSTLPEMMGVSQALSETTQAILILKDNLIVSGIETLVQFTNKRKIPLITSDEGSILGGGSFALGVHEKRIGIEGAEIAAQILNGTQACELPIHEMSVLSVFINKNAIANQNLSEEPILNAAKNFNYEVISIDKVKGK